MNLPLVIAIVVLLTLATWLVLVTVIWLNRPRREDVLAALPLVPELVPFLRSIRADPATPVRSRLAVGIVVAYLRSPIDLIPDLLPGIGAVDDLVLVGVALRGVARRVGVEVVRASWTGSEAGFAALRRLAGI